MTKRVYINAATAICPNLNFKTPIEGTSLKPVIEYQEGLPLKHVLSNSFGFGGNDSSLLFSNVE